MATVEFDDVKPVVIGSIIALNLALNSLVLAVIVRNPHLLEDRMTLFMFSLALADLVNGCTAMPINAAVCSRRSPNVREELHYLPRIQAFCSAWFGLISAHSLCWLTMCKMAAVVNPLRYEQSFTRSRCCFIIAGVWLFGAIVATAQCYRITSWDLVTCMYTLDVSTRGSGLLKVCLVVGLVLPLIVVIVVTTGIFFTIVRTHHQLTERTTSTGVHVDFIGKITALTTKSIRSARNVLVISLAYIILTVPVVVSISAAVFAKTDVLPVSFQFYAVWAMLSNTFVNGLLYLVLFPPVRGKAVGMLTDCCRCAYR